MKFIKKYVSNKWSSIMNRFRKFRRVSALLITPLILILLLRISTESDDILILDDDIAMSGIMGLTPQLFGAKGDGTTNDTKAVQKAIDYASKNGDYNVVFIPEGTYPVRNLCDSYGRRRKKHFDGRSQLQGMGRYIEMYKFKFC